MKDTVPKSWDKSPRSRILIINNEKMVKKRQDLTLQCPTSGRHIIFLRFQDKEFKYKQESHKETGKNSAEERKRYES